MFSVLCQNLKFRYPDAVFGLQVEDLSVDQGESVAVVGPSGCGKTTLLRLLAGILKPSSGKIEVAGTDLSSMSFSECQRFRIGTIGLVFQEFELLDYLSVEDNILLPFRVSSALLLDDSVVAKARALAESSGISSLLRRFPAEISQGERQRVALCRAMVTAPEILLADEPTGSLDPDNQEKSVALLRSSAAEAGASLIMVTHNHELLDGFDRVIDLPNLLQ